MSLLFEQNECLWTERKENLRITELLLGDILQSLEQSGVFVLVLLDLCKAFDVATTSGALLLEGNIADGQVPVCFVEGKLYEPVLVEYSRPQGSVLSPEHHVTYTKPRGDIIRSQGLQHHSYADDTQIEAV